MKKILALTLALVMCAFCFASCGQKNNDTLVCGVTIFENMNEKDADGNWTGFESEFAIEVGKIIGMDVEFQEIVWEQKYNELNSGAIDCIWNGFTANSSDNGVKRSELVDFSYGYMLNQQCIVVKSENVANYTSEEALAGKKACVEGGSAGESYAKTVTDEDKVFKATAQINAFTEVKSGAVDFIVVDVLLANRICESGDYANCAKAYEVKDKVELYAIGCRKGSNLDEKISEAMKHLMNDGVNGAKSTLEALSEKYGVPLSAEVLALKDAK